MYWLFAQVLKVVTYIWWINYTRKESCWVLEQGLLALGASVQEKFPIFASTGCTSARETPYTTVFLQISAI